MYFKWGFLWAMSYKGKLEADSLTLLDIGLRVWDIHALQWESCEVWECEGDLTAVVA